MATFRNPYNSAQIAKSFSNVADIFKPPSATDVYAGAKAQETREKGLRLEELYRYSQSPEFNKERFDRMGQATGGWTPNQSYYAVDQADGTKRFQIGVESKDRRYGTDVGAATSITNNKADNARAITTNTADNVRALDQTRIVDTGNTTRKLIDPIGKDQVQNIPPDVASLYKVDPQRFGIVEAKPGEENHLPDGRVIKGAPIPLTDAQIKARVMESLPKDQQEAIVFGSTPVDETGKGPMTRPQRLASNVPALQDKPGTILNYKTPDGRAGSAIWDPLQGATVDAQTRAPLPPGTQFQAPSGVQSKDPLGSTTANQTAANASAAADTTALDQLDIYEGLIQKNPGVLGIVGAIRGVGQDAIASAEDLARAFGDKAPAVKAAADSIRNGMQGVAPEYFDPSIPQAKFLQATIAYGIARTENPGGEVSRQAFERAMERVGGGLLSNSQQTLAQIAAYRQVLKAKQGGNAALRDPSKARTETGFPSAPTGPTTVNTKAGAVTITPVE